MRTLALACLILFFATGAALADGAVRVTLIHVNDVYQISPVDKGSRGGLARLATLKDQIKSSSPHTLLLLGGDTLSPSVASNTFKGAQMIAAWNAAGLDLAVVGNHEFDFGPSVLLARLGESRFPWLGANVLDKQGRLFGPLRTSEIRSFEGVKVGFLGVITASTAKSSSGGPGIVFGDPIATAKRQAARLRKLGAHVVVALTHLDMADDQRLAASGAVDLILGGHEHAVLASLAGHAPILKAGSDARNAARIDLFIDRHNGRLDHLDWELIPVAADIPPQTATAEVVAGFENRLSTLLDTPVGKTTVSLDARQASNRSQETNLGNWLADIYRASARADVAIVNGGSIRSNTTYGPGTLSKRDILSILPFENPIVKLDITGRDLRRALEHGLAETRETLESGRFPQISGLRIAFDARRPAGNRVTRVAVNDEALDDGRHYSLALSNYLAAGGDGYTLFKGLPFLIAPENALSETAEVIEALTAASPIAPHTDGRIERLDTP